jgi:hypothetical protein
MKALTLLYLLLEVKIDAFAPAWIISKRPSQKIDLVPTFSTAEKVCEANRIESNPTYLSVAILKSHIH